MASLIKTSTTMTASIVISTYNWKEALELTLLSAARQTVLPKEVIIADDGSRSDTRELIDRMRPAMPFPLIHVWQEDKGFRKALAMNQAFARLTADIVINIDGDIIMERHFVEDHLRYARPGCYLSGSRSKLTQRLNDRFFAARDYDLHWYTHGLRRWMNALRLPWLTPLFIVLLKDYDHGRGCNMSFWLKDLLAVNGYDGDMIGYGNEDTDLMARISAMGVKKRFVKFSCIQYHIHHKEVPSKSDKVSWRHNINLQESNEANCVIRVKNGIDRFLAAGD